jgi:ferric-dicitrate binding protein FerR (iron transport regulator)
MITFLALLTIPAWAAAPVAHITFTLGAVEWRASPGQTIQKASVGQEVPLQGVILTHARSVATITLPDQSVIKVGRDSEVALLEMGGAKGSTVISLLSGSLFSKVRKQENGRQFRVRTKNASMGVRGTEFFTSVNASEGDVWMCVREGTVAVEASSQAKPVMVGAGEGVLVPAGKSASKPKKFSWTKKLNWNMDPAAGEVLDETLMPSYGDLREQNYD